jgi:hypothetical protein
VERLARRRPSRDNVTEDISRHKETLRQKQHELRSLLHEWDPIGVYRPGSEGPPDEYDCLLPMIGKLRGGASSADLGKFLSEELSEHFGLDPKSARPELFAERVYRWYWQDPLPGSARSK